MRVSALKSIVISLLLAFEASAQDLPDKIRGYKVYKAKVHVTTSADTTTTSATDGDAVVKIDEPRVIDIGLTGVTFETDTNLGVMPQSGRIDFLTFRDFRVNGVAIEFDEYTHSFDVKKGVAIKLPRPVHGFVSSLNIAKAAYKEMVESPPTWHVTGTVFVFGKFKKFGFKFKRVVPVQIELKVKNPLT
ncbi:MAG: hypothetical protein WBD16_02075 [Pyrinomonadaceae bacterium]